MQTATGHIRPRKRKDGQKAFQLIAELPPDPLTGKRQRKYVTMIGTKKEAEKALQKLIEELQYGEYVDRSDVTLEAWMKEWLELYVRNTISPTTYVSYLDNMNNYIFPALGKIQLQSLTTGQIQKLINTLCEASPRSGKPMAPKTVKNIFLNINAAMEKAELLGMLRKNPCKHVVLPKVPRPVGTAYDEDEIHKLLNVAKGTDLELPLYIEICLGLRRGELLALKYSAIQWETNTISILESRVTAGNEVIVKCPKTQSGKRDLVVPAHLMQMLKAKRLWYLEQKLHFGGDFTDSDLVVCQPNGKPYHPDHFAKKFKRLLKENGLRDILFHDLRHTNASMMIASGIDIKVAQQRLGHSDVTTTLNIYSHVLNHANQAAANTIDSLVFKQSVNQ